MARPELNSLPEDQLDRSPVPAVVVWVYSRAASLLFVHLHLWLAGLEANHPLRDVNKIASLQCRVGLDFTLFQYFPYIHNKSLILHSGRAALA